MIPWRAAASEALRVESAPDKIRTCCQMSVDVGTEGRKLKWSPWLCLFTAICQFCRVTDIQAWPTESPLPPVDLWEFLYGPWGLLSVYSFLKVIIVQTPCVQNPLSANKVSPTCFVVQNRPCGPFPSPILSVSNTLRFFFAIAVLLLYSAQWKFRWGYCDLKSHCRKEGRKARFDDIKQTH